MARATQQVERGIANGREGVRCVARAHAAGVLAEHDVANEVEPVFSLPSITRRNSRRLTGYQGPLST
jgi:hypothetical protein